MSTTSRTWPSSSVELPVSWAINESPVPTMSTILVLEQPSAEATLGRPLIDPPLFAINYMQHCLGHSLNVEEELVLALDGPTETARPARDSSAAASPRTRLSRLAGLVVSVIFSSAVAGCGHATSPGTVQSEHIVDGCARWCW
ncbi:Uncharacterised protein [Mycobacteroides abscessus subsp. abscessus]|uniref:Uncharacterized protein n=1 Tax=Mycobacteroides abscessus subsp. abscessus TaxID=1185650 RepID=A0AB74FI91_9MYCO|nr:hypothetical protein [Mycobacteroides abscessus]EIV00726.1 hypothetical protein MA6G0728R_1120 [Mycobacteroides abscessus 6G-0728-R]EIV26514.1 hypothetical protein MA3A0122R_3634 [Mycobacteroides abscessus 3A-0122-R]ETZ66163.1 hypothetical protein L836_0806 [Mycobacteroides abscessus MAB_110811_2726]MBE5400462.1 hypothetical protein [Mycobacteroides abscessus]MBE5409590.1 hypothetical protein [Mycobacteroides abscessus]